MRRIDLSEPRQKLEAKRQELEHALRARSGIEIEREADPLDQLSSSMQRELSIDALDREATLLRQVVLALTRVSEGTYGVCIHCGEGINSRRLDAIPWATLCLECQQRKESIEHRAETAFELEDPSRSAAA